APPAPESPDSCRRSPSQSGTQHHAPAHLFLRNAYRPHLHPAPPSAPHSRSPSNPASHNQTRSRATHHAPRPTTPHLAETIRARSLPPSASQTPFPHPDTGSKIPPTA